LRPGRKRKEGTVAYEDKSWMSGLGYFSIGAGIGAILGVLYAPKAGSEIRYDMGTWLHDKRRLGRRQMREIQDAIEKGRRSVLHRAHRAAGR